MHAPAETAGPAPAQVVVSLPAAAAETVAAWLGETGAVEVRDATTMSAPADGATELVVAVSEAEVEARVADLGRYLDALRAAGEPVDPWSWRRETPPEGWRDRYKSFFRAQRVGRRVVVRPPWEDWDPDPDDVVVRLDPGQAFGTGAHASTRLCVRAIERIARLWQPPAAVLDLGSGSGILAVVAALVWPRCHVLALDTDPAAVQATRECAEGNGVAARVRAEQGSIERAADRYDLILANLQASALDALRPELTRRLSGRGRLVLSGLLDEEGRRIGAAYCADLAVEPEYSESEDGWRAIVVRRFGAVRLVPVADG